MINGVVIINKPKGNSSAQIVSKIKRIVLNSGLPHNKPLKVGHFGTLDPEAEGVLPIAIGRATRLFNYHLDDKKTYYTKFVFGFTTDTLDLTGKIIETTKTIPSFNDIEKACIQLEGESLQFPPKYSAKFINGQRAYLLARKGLEFELKPKKIFIDKIQLLSSEEDIGNDSEFAFRIICSAGTYIRSIVRDMANLVGTKGTMSFLKRESSGNFNIENAISVEEFEKEPEKHIIPIEKIISFPKLQITESQFNQIRNGLSFKVNTIITNTRTPFSLTLNNKIVGIAFVSNNILEVETWLI